MTEQVREATSRQLWRLQKERLLVPALERSGGEFVRYAVADELIKAWAAAHAPEKLKRGQPPREPQTEARRLANQEVHRLGRELDHLERRIARRPR